MGLCSVEIGNLVGDGVVEATLRSITNCCGQGRATANVGHSRPRRFSQPEMGDCNHECYVADVAVE